MVTPVENVRGAIQAIESLRRRKGDRERYWFGLSHERGYLDEDPPPIRVVTRHESLPLTRAMSAAASQLTAGSLWLFGRYLVLDILDDTPPELYFGPNENEAVRAIELLVALRPGGRIGVPTSVGSLALGLPGNALHGYVVLAADSRPTGWPG